MISFSSTNSKYIVSFDDSSESLVFYGQLDAARSLQENGIGEHWLSDARQKYSFTLELKRSEEMELPLYSGSLEISCSLNIKDDFKSIGNGYAELSCAQFDRIVLLLKGDICSLKFKAQLSGLNLKQRSSESFDCKFNLKASEISLSLTH